MTRYRIQLVPLGLAVLVALAACGTSGPSTSAGPEEPAPTAASPAGDAGEPLTGAGIAALVDEHVGDSFHRYSVFAGEEEGPSVLATSRHGGSAELLAVSLADEELAGEIGGGRGCDQPAGGPARLDLCEELPDGAVVSVSTSAHGFSDDNRRGRVRMGIRVGGDRAPVMVMYESYDRTFEVTPGELVSLMADPRLDARTEPGLNAAGEALPELRHGEG